MLSRRKCTICIRHHGAVMVARYIEPKHMMSEYRRVLITFDGLLNFGISTCPEEFFGKDNQGATGAGNLYQDEPAWCPYGKEERCYLN